MQADALRAAEAALEKKRQALQQAQQERDAADSAFRESLVTRQADDAKVQHIAGQLERLLAEAHGDKQRLQEENMALRVDVNSKKDRCDRLENKVCNIFIA